MYRYRTRIQNPPLSRAAPLGLAHSLSVDLLASGVLDIDTARTDLLSRRNVHSVCSRPASAAAVVVAAAAGWLGESQQQQQQQQQQQRRCSSYSHTEDLRGSPSDLARTDAAV